MVWLVAALLVFIFQIATILILEYRKPAKTVAWLLILFVLPIIGFVMYYFLAQEYRHRRRVRKQGVIAREVQLQALRRSVLVNRPTDMDNPAFHHQERLFNLLSSFSMLPITGCNVSEVLTNGDKTYSSMLSAMEGARHHIHLDFYTFRSDATGERFKEVLVRKASEGVEVRLIYDGVGSIDIRSSFVNELRDAGVQVQCFLAPRIAFFDKRINYRDHRKITVIDGTAGFVGGINIGDEYLGMDKKLGFWRDTHLRLEGDAVYYLQLIFMRDWWFTAREKLDDAVYMPEHRCRGTEQVQIVASGPDSNADSVLESMFSAIAAATKRIYIATPYFIPDHSVLMGLRTAALSGVDVRLILPHVSDSKLVMYASLSYVQELLEAGVRIFRYRKGFLHAKVLIVDELVAAVGTANMDLRSFFSNFEINAMLYDKGAIRRLEQDFIQDLDDSYELNLHTYASRSRRQRAYEVVAHMLSPLL
ncbi:cardiolipin synthase [Paenibacillus beijingensis]|uniref:Cardiolipin synthase n=1 Tax=Paenibacillus beijingensis TaxID=1126833 RepID=A0A0D5NGA7_9BACL|nr:cardiolipin synthase [Paenibacillus beijingensis]AJY73953.1 cardiolipin synthase [Paenibacillus beijingensis]